ncbi:MAG: 1,4-alpha-glucan branching enzyme, partial [Actinomycetota bacterium]|nr:1,4-alpha-glucan branching enzyme [Actinomycetota bacterium]
MTAAGLQNDIDKLVRGELRDPHHVLGRHPAGRKTVFRAYRPDASSVRVVSDGAIVAKLEQIRPGGVFEGITEEQVGDYQLEVDYPSGQTFTLRDPYAFLPTLGDIDLHLLGEGTHRRLWEKLGAHVRTIDGIEGVSFAVWAPNARSVRVVGEFNSWDGRLGPMRSLGASGIW